MTCDIEIEVGAGSTAGEYVARVVRAAAGGQPTAVLDLDVDSLLAGRAALEATVLSSAVAARRVLPFAEEQLRTVGRNLFDSLFSGPIYGVYRASMGVAQQRGEPLRVVLRLTAPQLAALPWEALYDPETETYICRKEPLVRHVPAPYTLDPLDVVPPLRVLGLIASPRDLAALDVAAEQQHLSDALAQPIADGLIELEWLTQATWDAVHGKLLSGRWHVLHFIGHGDYSIDSDQGLIALVGADGRSDLVDAERLADLLGEARPTPRLVFLNSCSSGESGAHDLFSGTAASLVRSGISAVAAMQFTVSDAAAIAFSRGFYTAIANGRGIDEATRSGRIAILRAAHTLEWVTPVLYLRGETARLFSMAPVPEGQRPAPPPNGPESADAQASPARTGGATSPPAQPQPPRESQLRALYLEARAELRAKHYDVALELLEDLLALHPSYRDGTSLRDTAVRQRELSRLYAEAAAAEARGEPAAAAGLYAQVLGLDPDYRDAMSRLRTCETTARVADLQDELRYHAQARSWDAVLEVDEELRALGPQWADPEGLATEATAAVAAAARAAEVERGYAEATAAEARRDWPAAARAFAHLADLDPAFRDVADRHRDCQTRLGLYTDLARSLRRLSADRSGVDTPAGGPPPVSGRVEETDVTDRVSPTNPTDPPATRAELGRGATPAARVPRARGGPSEVARIRGKYDVESLVWHPTANLLAVANCHAHVYDARGEEQLVVRHATGALGGTVMLSVAFSPDGRHLAAGSKGAAVWDLALRTPLLEVRGTGLAKAVRGLAFSPDGRRLVTGGDDRTACLWDARTGRQLQLLGHDAPVTGVAFNADGTLLATAGKGGARVFSTATWTEAYRLDHRTAVTAVAFHPDGVRLVTASHGDGFAIWDAARGTSLPSGGVDLSVTALAFTRAGDRLATGCSDGTVLVWTVGPRGITGVSQEVGSVQHEGAVTAVAFSADGSRLATGGKDHTTRIWSVATG